MPAREIKIHQAITLNTSVSDVLDTLGQFPTIYKEILMKLLRKQHMLLLSVAEESQNIQSDPNQLKLFSDEK